MRASRARSGPMANGTSVTTMRKNKTPIHAPPPTRTASRMSRTRSAQSAVMAAASIDPAAPAAALLPHPIRSVRGGSDNESAAGEMGAHEIGQHRLGRRIERRGRFIEQPDRPLDRDQPREREAAALPGGEIDRRQLSEPVEADGGKGGVALSRAAAEKMRPEVEVLLHRQRRLECVLVAKIVGLLADGELPITALKLEPPLLRPH